MLNHLVVSLKHWTKGLGGKMANRLLDVEQEKTMDTIIVAPYFLVFCNEVTH